MQPQQLQSFLKTADALKIKGLADQGLVPDHQGSAGSAGAGSTNNSSAVSTCSAPEAVVDKSDESAVEDESMSSFELQPPYISNPSPRIGIKSTPCY